MFDLRWLIPLGVKTCFHNYCLGEQILTCLHLNRTASRIPPVVDILENGRAQLFRYCFNILWAERGSFLVSEQDLEPIWRDSLDAVIIDLEAGFNDPFDAGGKIAYDARIEGPFII